MTPPPPGTEAWLEQVAEDVVDPQRPIIDPHHHLWQRPSGSYLLEDLWKDTGSGHRVEKTVFIECRANYRETGPDHLRCVGEVEFVREVARSSQLGGPGKPVLSGIVAYADLTRGAAVEEVLIAHVEAGDGLLRGIRHAGAHDPNPDVLSIPGRGRAGPYARDDFRQGLRALARAGLTYDTWHYHHQNRAFAELARAVPEATLILDHFGTPLGVGRYASQREAIFAQWRDDIAEIARCPNVYAKLGGLAMPDNGFGWDKRDRPASSDELVAMQRRYYLHAIECFGPDRCMFESNFPVDKRSISYRVLWNAFKKLARGFSDDEQHAMFHATATRVYRV
jgi:L-fuconolactonase